MGEGRSRAAWDHTANLIATLVNANPFRGPNARVVEPRDFHPHYRGEKAAAEDAPLKVPLSALFPLFARMPVSTPPCPPPSPE